MSTKVCISTSGMCETPNEADSDSIFDLAIRLVSRCGVGQHAEKTSFFGKPAYRGWSNSTNSK
jgi:hypothetical protein